MKTSFSHRHPLITALLYGLLCTFLTALGSALPQIAGLNPDLQMIGTTLFLALSVTLGLAVMKKSGIPLSVYGFRKSETGVARKLWWYFPLIVIELLAIILSGFSSEVTVPQYFIIFIFAVAVGFNEEIWFRGLAFRTLAVKSRQTAIIGTSLIFGILHLINVLNGKTPLYVILQIFFAALSGFVLAEIISIAQSLRPLILWHAAHNYIAMVTGEALDRKALILLALQTLILLIYAIRLWQTVKIKPLTP